MDSDDSNRLKIAEEFKTAGNELLKESEYSKALEKYTKAIEQNVSDNKKAAIYYANRSFVQIKLENYGFAIEDADEAIKKDATYAKGFYRKGSALFALGKYKESLDAFKKVLTIVPNDADAQEKYKVVGKIYKEKQLADAIGVEEDTENLAKTNFQEIEVPVTYDGPKLDQDQEITSEWVVELMEYMKKQKVMHKKFLWMMLLKIEKILKALPTLVEVEVPSDKEFTVCGDTHGQFYDLLNIFSLNGNPSADNPYLFNGDFVDRGSFSVEVIVCLLAWKAANPSCMHLTRGNHEARSMNKLYGFEGEVLHKYDKKTYEIFCDIFCLLPLAYVINKKVMVCHGGLFSKDGIKLSDIKATNRFREPPEEGIMCELLWSDPHPQKGRHPSKRGVGIGFGPDVAHKFLDDNGLSILIRSHEMKPNGYEVEADGRVITIFSAPNYCDQMGNKGAFIKLAGKDMVPKYTTFNAVEHPKIPVMAYARNFTPWM